MLNQNLNTEMLLERLPRMVNTANDKLTVILVNAEFALLELSSEKFKPLKSRFQIISALSEEIGVINSKIMRLLPDQIYNAKDVR